MLRMPEVGRRYRLNIRLGEVPLAPCCGYDLNSPESQRAAELLQGLVVTVRPPSKEVHCPGCGASRPASEGWVVVEVPGSAALHSLPYTFLEPLDDEVEA